MLLCLRDCCTTQSFLTLYFQSCPGPGFSKPSWNNPWPKFAGALILENGKLRKANGHIVMHKAGHFRSLYLIRIMGRGNPEKKKTIISNPWFALSEVHGQTLLMLVMFDLSNKLRRVFLWTFCGWISALIFTATVIHCTVSQLVWQLLDNSPHPRTIQQGSQLGIKSSRISGLEMMFESSLVTISRLPRSDVLVAQDLLQCVGRICWLVAECQTNLPIDPFALTKLWRSNLQLQCFSRPSFQPALILFLLFQSRGLRPEKSLLPSRPQDGAGVSRPSAALFWDIYDVLVPGQQANCSSRVQHYSVRQRLTKVRGQALAAWSAALEGDKIIN